jgi:hypothetical protein
VQQSRAGRLCAEERKSVSRTKRINLLPHPGKSREGPSRRFPREWAGLEEGEGRDPRSSSSARSCNNSELVDRTRQRTRLSIASPSVTISCLIVPKPTLIRHPLLLPSFPPSPPSLTGTLPLRGGGAAITGNRGRVARYKIERLRRSKSQCSSSRPTASGVVSSSS